MTQSIPLLRRTPIVVALIIAVLGSAVPQATSESDVPSSYIVQADTTDAAAVAVLQAGGEITDRLEIVDGVVATLGQAALARLRQMPWIALHANGSVKAANYGDCVENTSGKETYTNGCLLYPSAATAAHELHGQTVWTRKSECKNQGVSFQNDWEWREHRGWGVTVAVVDSGLMSLANTGVWKYKLPDGTLISENLGRCMVYRDFLPRSSANANSGSNASNSVDQHGHGTHVTSTIADNRVVKLHPTVNYTPVGVAPQVNLVVARALDKNGGGTYAGVIEAIGWIVANKDRYNIRVLNLSLYALVTGPYWADPLNQAVMRAWQAGIVVVAAAGNDGPTAGTITVPGNVPYVITVGAVRPGRYTASGYDELADYSSRGPTESAFVKPDVLVPGSRTIAPFGAGSTLANQAPDSNIVATGYVIFQLGAFKGPHEYTMLSGTSMAAAQVSGIVALMLQKSPNLTNNQVKARLLATARTAIDPASGQPLYSIWEQGAGRVDTPQAVSTTTTDSANVGMDIALDLDSDTHYWGYTIWDEAAGQFRLIDPSTGQPTEVWDGGFRTWSGGFRTWSGGFRTWSGGFRTWSGGFRTWSGGTSTWASSESLWAGGSRIWSGSTPATSPSTASTAEVFGLNDPTSRPSLPVRPILECVAANGNGTYTAYFGYLNENPVSVTIPVGSGNQFSPSPQSRGQPTTFHTGRTLYWPNAAFKVVFDGRPIVWTLNGGASTASRDSTRCGL